MTTSTQERALPVAAALGAIVHDLMWKARISQTAMGDAVGVKQSTFGKKLRGLVPITVDELTTIARVLGEDPGDLVLRACRDSNPKPSDLYLAICIRCGLALATERDGLCDWCGSAIPDGRVVAPFELQRCPVCGAWTMDGACRTPHGSAFWQGQVYTNLVLAA